MGSPPPVYVPIPLGAIETVLAVLAGAQVLSAHRHDAAEMARVLEDARAAAAGASWADAPGVMLPELLEAVRVATGALMRTTPTRESVDRAIEALVSPDAPGVLLVELLAAVAEATGQPVPRALTRHSLEVAIEALVELQAGLAPTAQVIELQRAPTRDTASAIEAEVARQLGTVAPIAIEIEELGGRVLARRDSWAVPRIAEKIRVGHDVWRVCGVLYDGPVAVITVTSREDAVVGSKW